MLFPPEVSNGSHFRKVVVIMEGIRIMDKVKISFLQCCLMLSPSNFTLDDSILLGCDAASLGNWLLTFWALKLIPLYLVSITHFLNFFYSFIAHSVYTRCTKINYKIVPVTNFNKYLHCGTSGNE